MLSWDWMASFWSAPIVEANLVVFMNLLGVPLLGLAVGRERSDHGRPADAHTNDIVCCAWPAPAAEPTANRTEPHSVTP